MWWLPPDQDLALPAPSGSLQGSWSLGVSSLKNLTHRIVYQYNFLIFCSGVASSVQCRCAMCRAGDDLALVCACLAGVCFGLPPCWSRPAHCPSIAQCSSSTKFFRSLHISYSLSTHHCAAITLPMVLVFSLPAPSPFTSLLRVLCNGCFVWGGFGLAAGRGFPWLGLVALLCLLLQVLLCAAPCVVSLCAGGYPWAN